MVYAIASSDILSALIRFVLNNPVVTLIGIGIFIVFKRAVDRFDGQM
jgi:hypothetical protein